jgi:DNA polymerase-3 subunit delta'
LGWQRILGHEARVEEFRRAIQRARLAHAYLFSGPRGVGKRTFAVELAKALLCEASPPGVLEPCDRCPACVQVEAGTHPDYSLAARPPEAQDFPIEQMREICQSFALKSARGRGRVVILDDADDLNEAAANCFLKTLEEPPPRSVLILIGSSPERQLSTIVSRCQVVGFAPLSAPLVDAVLAAQGIQDSNLRARLVRVSSGSPGKALDMADPAMWDFRRALLEGLAHNPRPSPDLGRTWMTFIEQAGKESTAQRRRARTTLVLLIDVIADALGALVGAPAHRTDEADSPHLQSLTARTSTDTMVSLLDRCLEADRQLERNVQIVLVLEALLDSLSQQLQT